MVVRWQAIVVCAAADRVGFGFDEAIAAPRHFPSHARAAGVWHDGLMVAHTARAWLCKRGCAASGCVANAERSAAVLTAQWLGIGKSVMCWYVGPIRAG